MTILYLIVDDPNGKLTIKLNNDLDNIHDWESRWLFLLIYKNLNQGKQTNLFIPVYT